MTKEETDIKYMKEAVRQAQKAAEAGEVPIGCVIVYNGIRDKGDRKKFSDKTRTELVGKIIGRGYNRRNTDKSTLSHAEITAIKKAGKKLDDWRLEGATMYVTLEPCQMCAGAVMQARMDRVVIGCMSPKAGCAGSVLNILEMDGFNHKVEVTRGVCEEECSRVLTDFFKEMRSRKPVSDEEN